MAETMRVGFIGPSQNIDEFRHAASLLGDLESDFIVYLGIDNPQPSADKNKFSPENLAEIALRGNAKKIRAVSAQYRETHLWTRIHRVPPPPAQSIEMVDDRIVVFLYNKAHLDEDDVFNASLVVYGNAPKLLLNKFGHRLFFSPGPLSLGRIGLLSTQDDGPCTLQALDMNARVINSETLQGRVAKISVS